MRVAVTGSTGLIGSALVASLRRDGADVVRLVRRVPSAGDEIAWDPTVAHGGLDRAALRGIDAVVHLAGAPVAARRWTPERKRVLHDSRVAATNALVSALVLVDNPPQALLCASGINWYGDTGDREVDEGAPVGSGFLAGLVRDWEAATRPASAAGIRVVNLRSGVVLSRHGGMIGTLLLPFRLGLGARVGTGRQYLTWISLTDEVAAIRFLLDRADIAGPVNLSAPSPVTNAEFTAALGRAVNRPAILAIPPPILRAALGEVVSDLLMSIRAAPHRLQRAGFHFSYPEISEALRAELGAR